MKYSRHILVFLSIIFLISLSLSYAEDRESYCLTGAFIADAPTKIDIENFKNKYGKKPYLIMVFIDWDRFIDKKVINDIHSKNCILFVTWEPWYAVKREGIDYNGLLKGKYDEYIKTFAKSLKKIKKDVFLRFGHEMNGNWYPWSGVKIGKEKYIKIYKYIKDIFDKEKTYDVKWVFSVNWEDIPKENNYFMLYYPGDEYVDYIGIDGYNWGNTQSWSKWLSFKDLFSKRYKEIVDNLKKPIIISEFSSASSGGNKALWIKEAMENMIKMDNIKAFVLFNVDKEVDWSFPINKNSGKEFRKQLEKEHFRDYNSFLKAKIRDTANKIQ